MFHLYIILAYIIPNIYGFLRIKDLFITKRFNLLYIIIYLLIAAIYPVFEIYSKENTNFIVQLLTSASSYILAFYLYIFLLVLLFDIFLLLNIFLKIVSYETRRRFTFRFHTITAMILISIAVVIAGSINLNTIRVSEYNITVPKKKSKIDHLSVAMVADFHIQQSTSQSFIEQFVKKTNALQPDLILFCGDMVEGDNENETTEAIETTFKKIKTKYGAFGVPGNHEFHGGQQQGSFFKRAGIKLLCDTVVMIDSSFYLAGRYDQHLEKRKTIIDIIKIFSPDMPLLLMDHRPTELKEVSNTTVNIQFSGHTHDGQLFPLNLITGLIYELSWGYKKINNTQFFVTSGLRLWGPPVKTAGKSEIMLINIRFE